MPASTHIVPQVTRSTHIAITQTLHCVGHTVEHRYSLASWKTKLLDYWTIGLSDKTIGL